MELRNGCFCCVFVCVFFCVFFFFFKVFEHFHVEPRPCVCGVWCGVVWCCVCGCVYCCCCRKRFLVNVPRREAGDFLCLPPVWNIRAFSLIPLFYTSSFVLLSSPVALLFYLFLLLAHSPDFISPKSPFSER